MRFFISCGGSAAALVISAVLAGDAAAATTAAEAFFEKVMQTKPRLETIKAAGRTVGSVRAWTVNNPASSYDGLTLVWAELDAAAVDLTIDGRSSSEPLSKFSSPATLLITGGGSWVAAPGEWQRRTAAGLLIPTNAAPPQALPPVNQGWPGGGVLVRCGSSVAVVPVKAYRPACAARPFGALQAKVLLVRNGKAVELGRDVPANHVAVGTGGDKLFIAGAFNRGGALPLGEFATFVATAARNSKITFANAIDLEDACPAEIYVTASRHLFSGCGDQIYETNRIIINSRGAP